MQDGNKTNEIYITGRLIASRKRQDGKSVITVVSKNGADIFLHFICDQDMKLPELRNHVTVRGHMEPYMYRDSSGSYNAAIDWIADEASVRKTLAEERFGKRGKFYRFPECEIALTGTLKKIKEEKDWIRYVILPDLPENDKHVPVTVHMKKPDRLPTVKVGERVGVVCRISTPVKEREGKKIYYEDIMVEDIATI